MSYRKALEAAGVKVLAYEEFGSYQGDWWAKIEINGVQSWVTGCFGSCSGCDSFQSEFNYDEDGRCEKHKYDTLDMVGCKECEESAAKYKQKLSDFGKSYLDNLMIQEDAEKEASKNLEWDMEADKMLKWIKENSINNQ